MDDLRLWTLLEADELDVEAILALLPQCAKLPIQQRAPFFGSFGRLLRHSSAALRVAAVQALHDASGPLAVRAMVHALDDGEPRVREAAVEALRSIAARQPYRFAHALFHREPSVRAAALSGPLPPTVLSLAFYLLADPELAPRVEALGVRPSNDAFDVLIAFAEGGQISLLTARRMLAETHPADLMAWASRAPWRSPAEAEAVIVARRPTGHDRLDDLFALFLREGDDPFRARFVRVWTDYLTAAHAELSNRVVAAILAAMERERPAADILGIAVNHRPELLAWTRLDRAVRERALDAIYAEGPKRDMPEHVLEDLLRCDLARRPKGGLDLRTLGAVLCFRPMPRYAWLIEKLGEAPIISAFLRDPVYTAAFLSITDRSARGREWMLEQIVHKARDENRWLVYALYASLTRGNELAPVAKLAATDRISVIDRLFEIEHRENVGFDAAQAKALATALVTKEMQGHIGPVLECWLRRREASESALGPQLLARMCDLSWTEPVIDAIATLPTFPLRRLVALLEKTPLLSVWTERAIALRVIGHSSPKIAEWAERRTPRPVDEKTPLFGQTDQVTEIPGWLAALIRSAPDLADGTIQRLHGAPNVGLTAALAARPATAAPNIPIAVALFGSHDPLPEVCAQLERYISHDAKFLSELEAAVVAVWCHGERLPLFSDAWMWRFEQHGLRAADTMIAQGLTQSLASALELGSPVVTEHLWAAAGSSLAIWRHRFRERLVELVDAALFDLLIAELDTSVGYWAARMLVAFHEARVAVELLRERADDVRARLPDLADDVRDALAPYVSIAGLAGRGRGARAGGSAVGKEILESIQRSKDLDALCAWCRSPVLRAAHEAALRLVVLGEPGCLRIAALLGEEPPPIHLEALTASIPLWPDASAAFDVCRRLLSSGRGAPELRFRVAIALAERGDMDAFRVAVEAACAPIEDAWMSRADFERLRDRAPEPEQLACELALSPHAHAYLWAVSGLMKKRKLGTLDLAALRAFLQLGTDRALRVEVSNTLVAHGDFLGLPIIAGAELEDEGTSKTVLAKAPARDVARIVTGGLHLGSACEMKIVGWLDHAHVDRGARELAFEELLAEADDEKVRAAVVQRLPRAPTRAIKLRRLAETFAWGLVVGRELLGRVYRIHMISSEAFGYTRLNERRIYVTPLPILRGDRRGQEVVEGLILHELGHHRHHAGPANAAVWQRADKIGLGRLLNLVADEHLERNLRGVDSEYGDRLKRLAAYAFQHAAREIDVWVLTAVLGRYTLPILSACEITTARRPTALRIETGQVLTELEAAGSSFAKFVRAMRMGLGRRHADPKVNEALALFGKGFKRSDMERLYEITLELHRIFGGEVQLVDAFGGPESLEDSLHDRAQHGEGIDDAEVQRAVDRILGPPGDKGGRSREAGGRLQINVGADESFEVIHEVQHVEPNEESHRAVAKTVSRHARRLRTVLERLGLAREPSRMRLAGHRLDTTRIRPLVVHGDPRILLARTTKVKADLYLGIIIDCSGSMQGESMERAHAFGVLLAEAVRGMKGVDLGIFGFDDATIFEAGDARRPAVTSLEAGAGNNDAAGLWHVAQVAMASRRKAKVLVMISDGLPTECSVDALRALVRRLTRRHGLCCAQVAVRPIEELMFPHYVEIDDDNLDAAVRRFGTIVARLVGRTLSA
jgi:hypothetical protein